MEYIDLLDNGPNGLIYMMIPVVKLGTLAIRTFSKPIANRLKKDAGLHPKFREFIIDVAQMNHRFTTNMQRRIYGRATDELIRPLHEERAINAAAALLGEFFIFTVAGVALVYEVQRNSRAEAKKEELRKQELEALKQRDKDLEKEVQMLKQRLQEMERSYKKQSFFNCFEPWYTQAIGIHK